MSKNNIINNLSLINAVKELRFLQKIKRDSDIAQDLGVSKSLVSEYLNNKKQVSDSFLSKFFEHYSLNRSMYESAESVPQADSYPLRDALDLGAFDLNDQTEEYRGKQYIDLGHGHYQLRTLLVPTIATMGYLSGFGDPEWLAELPTHTITVTKIPHGLYRTFVGKGDSMDDGSKRSISDGDYVTGRVIDKQYWTSKLHLHKYQVYIIVHKEGITIKEITNHDVENGIITIHSWNPDKKSYPDRELKLADVLQLLNVIKIERDV